jgi:hypothetical protein
MSAGGKNKADPAFGMTNRIAMVAGRHLFYVHSAV